MRSLFAFAAFFGRPRKSERFTMLFEWVVEVDSAVSFFKRETTLNGLVQQSRLRAICSSAFGDKVFPTVREISVSLEST